MRPLKNGSVRNVLRGLRRHQRTTTANRFTRRRVGVGAGVVALLGGVYYALRARR